MKKLSKKKKCEMIQNKFCEFMMRLLNYYKIIKKIILMTIYSIMSFITLNFLVEILGYIALLWSKNNMLLKETVIGITITMVFGWFFLFVLMFMFAYMALKIMLEDD